jgi:hypothetical protein
MCIECRHDPCHPSCPNAPDDPVACTCDWCGNEIYEGNYYYEFDSICVCEECMDDCKTEAELPEPEPSRDDFMDEYEERQIG